jgi:hypothetical protein
MVHLSGPTSWVDLWTILVAVVTVLGAGAPFVFKKVVPAVRRRRETREAMHAAIIGAPAVRDKATGEIRAPAIPGIADRMGAMEKHMAVMAETVASLNDAHSRLDGVEERVKALEEARVERVVAQAESAQIWRAVADGNLPAKKDDEEQRG